MKVRIKFSKNGVLKYIGHLDLMRYFQKAFRRTDIRVTYSKGFSPHMIMSFAQALGVGVESDGEYFDVEVEDGQDLSTFKDKLNSTMAEGIEIEGVWLLNDKAQNAMASVAASDWKVEFYEGCPITDEAVKEFNESEQIEFIKVTKSNETVLNLKDYVFSLKKEDNLLFFQSDSSSMNSLKPKFLLEKLSTMSKTVLEDYKYHVKRLELYRRNKQGNLVPLSEVEDE